MKVGDIIENPWTTKANPLHHAIYFGVYGKNFRTLYFYQGRFQHATYRKEDREKFKVVGHLKEYDDFKNAIRNLDKSNKEVAECHQMK